MKTKRIEFIAINTERSGYSPDQCGSTMTVRGLIQALEQFDDDTLVYLKNDGGYTYGAINDSDIEEDEYEEDEECEDE